MPTATTMFRAEEWNEVPIAEGDVNRLSRASCRQSYTGELSGESILEYLMVYRRDGSAAFCGIERITGTLAGRKGSFVVRQEGEYDNGVARLKMEVVEGTGTDELEGLTGHAVFESPHAKEHSLTLEYSFGGDRP